MSAISGLGSLFSSASVMRSSSSPMPPSFQVIDTDSSGGISLDELSAHAPSGMSSVEGQFWAKKLFSEMDTDGDGSVTRSEKDAFDDKMSNLMQSMQIVAQLAGQNGAGGQQMDQSPGGRDNISVSNILQNADMNTDGALSLDEFMSATGTDSSNGITESDLKDLFSSIDADGDGSVTKAELQSYLDRINEDMVSMMPPPAPDRMAMASNACDASLRPSSSPGNLLAAG